MSSYDLSTTSTFSIQIKTQVIYNIYASAESLECRPWVDAEWQYSHGTRENVSPNLYEKCEKKVGIQYCYYYLVKSSVHHNCVCLCTLSVINVNHLVSKPRHYGLRLCSYRQAISNLSKYILLLFDSISWHIAFLNNDLTYLFI